MQINNIQFHSIGMVHSPFTELKDMPIQPSGASGVEGTLIIHPEYTKGLCDLAGFSHIYLLYFFHRVKEFQLKVTPFLDNQPRGIFATRAPRRPNPIGLSILLLVEINNEVLRVRNIDILDGTPILDIKPYVPAFDQPKNVKIGWLTNVGKGVKSKRSDERFK